MTYDNPALTPFDPRQPVTPSNRPDVAYFYDTPVADLDVGDGTTMTGRNTAGFLAYVWDLTGEEHYDYSVRETTTAVVSVSSIPRTGSWSHIEPVFARIL